MQTFGGSILQYQMVRSSRRAQSAKLGYRALGSHKQPGGKTVHAWAVEADCDPAAIRSNTFTMEWPPRSGRKQEFPEIDRAAWFPLAAAREKIHKGQVAVLDALVRIVGT